MSSVMIAADSTAIEHRYLHAPARAALPPKERVSLLRRAQGVTAGVLFLAVRVPVYAGVLLFGALVSLLGAALYLIRALGLRLVRPAGTAALGALALVCIASPQRARADTVNDTTLLEQATVVFGQETTLDSFTAPGAGTLSMTIKDLGFPISLQQLTGSILSQDQTLGSLTPVTGSEWQLDVPIHSGGIFAAFVAAQAGTFDGLQLGAYSLSINFEPAPVPLPAAVDLLLGGLGLLGAVTLVERISRRRNGDVISVA